jgi:hypothetical protein
LTVAAPAGCCRIARNSRVVNHGSQLWAEALEAVFDRDVRHMAILAGRAPTGHQDETNATSLRSASRMTRLAPRPGYPMCRSVLAEAAP